MSDFGRVRSLLFSHKGKERILKPKYAGRGYIVVVLYKNMEKKQFFVHRLVYEAFHGPIPFGLTVDHIDSEKLNNRLENLQLLTREENTRKGNIGKKKSEETKKKISQAQKAYWNKKKGLSAIN